MDAATTLYSISTLSDTRIDSRHEVYLKPFALLELPKKKGRKENSQKLVMIDLIIIGMQDKVFHLRLVYVGRLMVAKWAMANTLESARTQAIYGEAMQHGKKG